MKCPIDGEVLLVAERSGVEIDYCPKCRGVWLDRGELEKIIERAAESPPPYEARDRDRDRDRDRYNDRDRDHYNDRDRYRDRDRRPQKNRAASLLGELFDF